MSLKDLVSIVDSKEGKLRLELAQKAGFLNVGEFSVYNSLDSLDTGAYSEGLGKVILEDNEEVLAPLERKDLESVEFATKEKPLTFMGDGSLTLGYLYFCFKT